MDSTIFGRITYKTHGGETLESKFAERYEELGGILIDGPRIDLSGHSDKFLKSEPILKSRFFERESREFYMRGDESWHNGFLFCFEIQQGKGVLTDNDGKIVVDRSGVPIHMDGEVTMASVGLYGNGFPYLQYFTTSAPYAFEHPHMFYYKCRVIMKNGQASFLFDQKGYLQRVG